MKVCEKCGEEIGGRGGDNLCQACEDGVKRAKRALSRKQRESIMRSMGLVKVRGALGGTYWE
jgi:hypothetical protein